MPLIYALCLSPAAQLDVRLQNTLMAIIIGYLCASGINIVIEMVFIAYTSILMSR